MYAVSASPANSVPVQISQTDACTKALDALISHELILKIFIRKTVNFVFIIHSMTICYLPNDQSKEGTMDTCSCYKNVLRQYKGKKEARGVTAACISISITENNNIATSCDYLINKASIN